jgi:hypothetical protein
MAWGVVVNRVMGAEWRVSEQHSHEDGQNISKDATFLCSCLNYSQTLKLLVIDIGLDQTSHLLSKQRGLNFHDYAEEKQKARQWTFRCQELWLWLRRTYGPCSAIGTRYDPTFLLLMLKNLSHSGTNACILLEKKSAKLQASITRRLQLASRRRLLQIAYQIGPSEWGPKSWEWDWSNASQS